MESAEKAIDLLTGKYGDRKHPLNYNNRYQLLVMIVLSAQTTDNIVNKLAPEFFKAFPSISELKLHQPEDLYPYISNVRGYRKKAEWIIGIAKSISDDSAIPRSMDELVKLHGFGRKSANVLIRESGDPAEGVMVDLHVARVAPRIGIVTSDKPEKIEKEIMAALPREKWGDAGMALSYHGREICRPKPECEKCIVREYCQYYRNVVLSAKGTPV